jgi:hypothetical protein
MASRPLPTRKQAIRLCVVAAATAVTCAGLLVAAALADAPVALLPLIVVLCVGCPMLAAWELPPAVAAFRHHRERIDANACALAELRAGLAKLPETSHPLGF